MYSALIQKDDIGQVVLLFAIIIFMILMYKLLPKDKDYFPPIEDEDNSEEKSYE